MIIETGEINLVDGGSVRGTGQMLEDLTGAESRSAYYRSLDPTL